MKIKHLLQLVRPTRRSILGLDITSAAIKMLGLSVDGVSLCLECYGSVVLPQNTLNGHLINDVDALAHSIKALFNTLKPNSKQVVLAVPDAAIISKVLHVYVGLTDKELEEFIFIEAAAFIPYPMDEINLDFKILGPVEKNHSLLEVLVVASRAEHVMMRVEAVRRGGLEVLVVDIASYAMARAVQNFTKNTSIARKNKSLIIIDLNEQLTHLFIFQEMKLVYSREEQMRGLQFTKAATTYFKNFLESDLRSKEPRQLPTEYLEQILVPFEKDILVWIKRALQFFYSTSTKDRADHILLTGSFARLPGLTDLIQDQLAILTTVADPFSSMLPGKNISLDSINNDAPAFMIASGLALRGLESYADTN